jgi:hypothetical protein
MLGMLFLHETTAPYALDSMEVGRLMEQLLQKRREERFRRLAAQAKGDRSMLCLAAQGGTGLSDTSCLRRKATAVGGSGLCLRRKARAVGGSGFSLRRKARTVGRIAVGLRRKASAGAPYHFWLRCNHG